MKKELYVTLSFILLLFCAVAVHLLLSDTRRYMENSLTALRLTHFVSPALMCSWYEPRSMRFERARNYASPQMPPQQRLDFVYGELYEK